MLLKRFIAMGVLSTLCSGIVPLAAFATDDGANDSVDAVNAVDTTDSVDSTDSSGSDSEDLKDSVDDNSGSADQSDDAVSDAESDVKAEDTEGDDEVKDDLDDVDEDVTEGDDETLETAEGTTITSEDVSEDSMSTTMIQDLEDASSSGEAPDQFYLAVMWGYFGSDQPTLPETSWDGTIVINNEAGAGVFSRPVKTLMFERQQDSIDFSSTTVNETAFNSSILNMTDGILFKVRTDLSSTDAGKVSFSTAYSPDVSAAYLDDLYTAGAAEFVYGEYKVVMKVMTRDEWISAHSDHNTSGRSKPTDSESGSWYEKYMNVSLDHNFVNGYKDSEGHLTGEIGPADSLTRFQLFKILYELSAELNMGVASTACDPETVTTTSATDWMGELWARGYVQCIEDSGVSVTLLTFIGSDLSVGQEPAQRWEVVASAFEMLGLNASGAADTTLSDVASSGLGATYVDMIDKAVELGVLSGYPDGTFKPYATVNRAEMFKMVTLFYEVLAL